MELPPYRMPTSRSTLKHMWIKASQYLKKMSGVILIASILLWALGYYPRYKPAIKNTPNSFSAVQTNLNPQKINQLVSFRETAENGIPLYHDDAKNKQLENSYIGRLGKFIEPAIKPLGFDWKMGISLITGIAAKEIVVSTLGVLHHVDIDSRNGEKKLSDLLSMQEYKNGPMKGQRVFSPLATISFLIFILIYFPCIAVFAAVKKETGNIWWAVFMIFYTTILAYLMSLIVFQVGKIIIVNF